MILDQEKISRIKNLLKFKPKGMSISDISHSLKMNRNSVAKYLDLLLVSGQVEMQSYGTAKVYFLSQRVPLSAMLSLASDLVIILDSDFRIIQVNENFLSTFEMTRDALIGKLLTDVPLSFVPRLPLDDVVRESPDKKEIKIDVTYSPGPETGRSVENVYYRARLVPTVFEEGSRGITILLENVTNTKIYEHQLEASEARYRNIIEDQTEFISRFLPDGTHRFVNEAYLRYFGLKREEVENKIFIPVIPPEDKALVKAHFASFSPESPVQSIDHRIMMPDGNVRWQRWSDRAIFDEHGKITEYQSVGRDITDQKNAEVKAAEYIHGLEVLSRKGVNFVETGNPEDIFRSIGEGAIELVPDAVVVVHSYDETTRLFSTRMVLDETSRYQIKSLIGMDPLMMTYPISDRPRENLLSTKLVRIDTPLYDAINHSVSREKCEDVEKILNITSIYIIGLARKEVLLGRVALLMKKNATPSRPDIFEAYIREASIALQRCYAEEAFRDNEEQFRNIVDYSPFPISIVDKTGVITYLNSRFTEVFGYEKHELPTIHDWQEKATLIKRFAMRWKLHGFYGLKLQRLARSNSYRQL